MALSIPAVTSVTLGVGFPSRGSKVVAFTTTALIDLKDNNYCIHAQNQKQPDAGITGFLI